MDDRVKTLVNSCVHQDVGQRKEKFEWNVLYREALREMEECS